ncbi:hypothetical protein BDR26DRAFT_1006119 [Obelidium mucronatum]|nr:hypothetical protein BDR26DRAFT_1006119 [Obelidium mucronatum]
MDVDNGYSLALVAKFSLCHFAQLVESIDKSRRFPIGINPRSLLTSNHAALVNKVYPTDPGETGPRPSHLSTLLFYANSKPIKLVKVGEYLVKKVETDLGRSKIGFVKVSLQIVDALMAQCPATHINLMAKNVLKIIDLVLASPDPELILEATSTFVTFNSLYRHDTIMDIELTSLYSKLVHQFCGNCTLITKNTLVQQKIHLSGLRAIQSIAASDTFLVNPKAPEYVSHMIPAILSNLQEEKRLRSTSEPPRTPGLPNATPPMQTNQPHHNSITDDLFTHPLLEQSAQESLSVLFKNGTRESLRFLIPPLWAFLEEKKLWGDKSMVVHVMTVVSGSVAPQYHYLLMASLLEKLKGGKRKDQQQQPLSGNVIEKTGVVLGVVVLVSAGGAGAAGISVVELLEALVALVVETAVPADSDRVGEDGDVRAFHGMLVEAVGALGVHIAYPTQLNDIVSFIVNRVGRVEGSDAAEVCVRKSLIRCLLRVVSVRRACLSGGISENGKSGSRQSLTNLRGSVISNLDGVNFELDKFSTLTRVAMGTQKSNKAKRTSLTLPARISAVLLIPLLPYLVDMNQDIRILSALFLNSAIALDVVQSQLDDALSVSKKQVADEEFVHLTYQKLHSYALLDTSGPVDFVAMGTLISMFLRKYGSSADGVGSSIQFLLKLQNDVVKSTPTRKTAVQRLFIDHLKELAGVFTLPALKTYLEKFGPTSAGIPLTTKMETLSASVEYWVIKNGSGDSAEAAARTFSSVANVQDPSPIPASEILPLLYESNLINVDEVKAKIGEEFHTTSESGVDLSQSAVSIGGKRYSGVVEGGLSVVSIAKLATRPSEGLGVGKKDVESVRSGASFRADTPIKFEDLKDAISIHSSSTEVRVVDSSLRTVTPTPKGKIDVKKLLNNISTSITNVSTHKKSHFLEPSHLGKHSLRFGSSSGDKSQDLGSKAEPQPGTSPEEVVVTVIGTEQDGVYLPAKVAGTEN